MEEKLFKQFPSVSTEQWMNQINADLKGADFNKLVWRTGEGFDVRPFYRQEDLSSLQYLNTIPGEFPFLRGSSGTSNWRIRQDIEVTDYASANRKALEVLMKGIDSIGFNILTPDSVSKNNFDILLKDISIEAVELNFLSNGRAAEILEIIKQHVSDKPIDPSLISGAIETDPLGRLMRNGTLCIEPEKGFDYLASLSHSSLSLPSFRTIHLKASAFGNAGADIVQELGFALSMANEYIFQLTERGLTPREAASRIRFSFGCGSGYFPEMAKFRAARMLWSAVQEKYTGDPSLVSKMEIHSITSRFNKTIYDPYVNMLRTQSEAMSAILGGTDSLTVEPFDSIWKTPGEFSERIARNQQLILKEEAHFDKVLDPSAGSYYIENLTSLIADKAWKIFVETEEQGGFLEALKKGFIQARISESSGRRRNDAASRKTVILGTNQYPRTGEKAPETPGISGIFNEKVDSTGNIVDAVVPFRISEEYEKIRIATERSGRIPAVFLFTIGNPAMRRARAQFSTGFFGCAGYNIIDNNGFESIGQGIEAAIDSKAEITVICSSDDEYAILAPEISRELKGRSLVVIAGNPPCAGDLKAQGVEYFIHLKSNVPDTLGQFNEKLGIGKL